MVQEIYLIDNESKLDKILQELFKENKEIKLTKVKTKEIETVLKNIPSLIIVNDDGVKDETVEICKKIKSNEDNNITPIIIVSSKVDYPSKIEMLKLGISNYIENPINYEYLYYIINNILRLLYVNRRVSPLTGLPGNVQIRS